MSHTPLYFDRNENPYGPAPACFEVLRNAGIDQMSNYSRDFARGVKSTLSERLAGDYGIPEASILLGYGGEDILKQTVHCYLPAGGRILIPSHSWWYYKTIADEVRGIKVEYPIVEGEDSYYYDIDTMLRQYEEHHPQLVLISSPNNPTGNSLGHEDLLRVLDTMRDTVVVLDEAYWSHDGSDAGRLRMLYETYPNLVIVRTFSKYFALAGVRIGYAIVGAGLEQLGRFSARYLGYHRLSELVALAALDSPEYYANVARAMAEDKQLYRDTLGALPGFKVFTSHANFILVRIPSDIKSALKSFLDARALIPKFMNEEALNSHLRITIGTKEQNRLLIDAITEFMSSRVDA
ncbi:MAG TPA: histidinol-phosphate transaminase [Bacteroidota bacterium]|nr:histidinol-phosphate transaminase [Bacteroidota bacterium]